MEVLLTVGGIAVLLKKKKGLLFLRNISAYLPEIERALIYHKEGVLSSPVWSTNEFIGIRTSMSGYGETAQPGSPNPAREIRKAPLRNPCLSQSFMSFILRQLKTLCSQGSGEGRLESQGKVFDIPPFFCEEIVNSLIATLVLAFSCVVLPISLSKYYIHHHSALCWQSTYHLQRK